MGESIDTELVSAGDIARIAGVTRSAISQWGRRYTNFPAPIATTAGGRVWLREDIIHWLVKTGRLQGGEE